MTKKFITTLAVVALLFVASSAKAQVSKLEFVQTTPPADALADHVTNDLVASFAGQYTGAQILLELTAGSIYQDGVGSALPPNAAFFTTFKALQYDTYLAQGSETAGGSNGEPSPGGGAVDLGGAAGAVFTNAAINQAWNPPGGVVIVDQTDFLLARITLTKDAAGTAHILASAGAQPLTIREIPVLNGAIGATAVIPEPTTLMLAAFGLVGVVGSRRRRS